MRLAIFTMQGPPSFTFADATEQLLAFLEAACGTVFPQALADGANTTATSAKTLQRARSFFMFKPPSGFSVFRIYASRSSLGGRTEQRAMLLNVRQAEYIPPKSKIR
jgi:hypothetical protein